MRICLLCVLLCLLLCTACPPDDDDDDTADDDASDDDVDDDAAADDDLTDDDLVPDDDVTDDDLDDDTLPDDDASDDDTQGEWHVEAVDALDAGEGSSIAVDDSGAPHISYVRDAHQEVVYAVRGQRGWTTTVVDRSAAGKFGTSLALDQQQYARVAYRETVYVASRVRVADNRSGNWMLDTLLLTLTADDPSLALPTNGPAAVVAPTWDEPKAPVLVRYWEDISHPVEYNSLFEFMVSGCEAELALDANNNPHVAIAYLPYDIGQARLFHYWWTAGAWQHNRIGAGYNLLGNPDIATAPAGWVGISFATAQNLVFASNASGEWQEETVDNRVGLTYSALAIDDGGAAHLAYYDGINGDLRYATNRSGAWVVTVIDAAGDVGGEPSIALDDAGHPHLAYQDIEHAALKYAWWE